MTTAPTETSRVVAVTSSERERALYETILASPDDDDAARLVYADALEAAGHQARGELIQVQCQLARMDASDPRWSSLKSREWALDKEHAKEWLAELWTLALPHTKFPGLGDEAAGCLAAWKGGQRLRELWLRGSHVTAEARDAILGSPARSALRTIVDGA